MHFRNLTVIVPFALLAACGGSGSSGSGEGTAAPEAASVTQAPALEAPAPEASVPATPGPAAPAPETSAPATAAVEASPAASASPTVAAATPPTAAAPTAFAVCRACHSVEPGKNGVGPTLFGIVGSTAGEVPGYAFSPALKKSGIVWDREKLDTWLQGPMKMVPGTKMVITVPDPAKRKAIIDYLETVK